MRWRNTFERSDETHRKVTTGEGVNIVVCGDRKTLSLIAMVLFESLISTFDPLSSATLFTVLFSTSLLTPLKDSQTLNAFHIIVNCPVALILQCLHFQLDGYL